MNKYKYWLMAGFMLLLCNTGFTQSKLQKLENAIAQLRLALIDADSVKLMQLTSPQLSYGHSSGKIDNQQDFVSKIVSGKSDFITMELQNQTITIAGKTAVVRHKLDATINDNGKPGEVHLLVLLIWQKQHGDWKLLARQAVKQPQ